MAPTLGGVRSGPGQPDGVDSSLVHLAPRRGVDDGVWVRGHRVPRLLSGVLLTFTGLSTPMIRSSYPVPTVQAGTTFSAGLPRGSFVTPRSPKTDSTEPAEVSASTSAKPAGKAATRA